jgi:hypothetical protein
VDSEAKKKLSEVVKLARGDLSFSAITEFDRPYGLTHSDKETGFFT